MMKAIYEYNGRKKTVEFTCKYTPAERNNLSISLFELALQAIVAEIGVSTNVYTNRPKALAPTIKEFAIVSIHSGVNDNATYGECNAHVSVFAKDVAEFKNSQKLAVMSDKVLTLPQEFSVYNGNTKVAEYILDDTPSISPDSPDDFGFHSRLILFKVTIKIIQ